MGEGVHACVWYLCGVEQASGGSKNVAQMTVNGSCRSRGRELLATLSTVTPLRRHCHWDSSLLSQQHQHKEEPSSI